jgi:23S rRNA (uracil1939-C5)-methyltransferase
VHKALFALDSAQLHSGFVFLCSPIAAPNHDVEKMNIKVGDIVPLSVVKPVLGGAGLARWEGMAVFVPGALPGQRIMGRITALKPRHARAEVLQVLEQSQEFTPPLCDFFGTCGGCDWLHMAYDRQLHWKRKLVQETLHHIGRQDIEVPSLRPSLRTDNYRNKMEFAFAPEYVPEHGKDRTGLTGPNAAQISLGLHPRGIASHVLPISCCRLCPEEMTQIREFVCRWAQRSGLPAYNPETGKGFWRHLVLRQETSPHQLLACLITTDLPQGRDIGPRLADDLHEHIPAVTSFVHDVRHQRDLLAVGQATRFQTGWNQAGNMPDPGNMNRQKVDQKAVDTGRTEPGYLFQRLGDMTLCVSHRAFNQINPEAARLLRETALDFADLSGAETVWELYCGVGALTLLAAARAKSVAGMEIDSNAVRDARDNLEINRRNRALAHCRFLQGDVLRSMVQARNETRPDVIIADPPRGGMHAGVVSELLRIRARKLVLISCDPATLARDVKRLASGYNLCAVQPVDMFPHTSHIECVAQLVAK